MKFTLLGAWLFLIVALLHLLRAIFGIQVTIGTYMVPTWVSMIAFIIPLIISIMIFKEVKHK